MLWLGKLTCNSDSVIVKQNKTNKQKQPGIISSVLHQVFVPDEYTGTYPESSRQWRKGLYENPCENGKAKSLIPHSRAIGTMASDRLYCYSVWEIVSWTIEFHVLVITGTIFFVCSHISSITSSSFHDNHTSSLYRWEKQSLEMLKNLPIVYSL